MAIGRDGICQALSYSINTLVKSDEYFLKV